MRAQFHYNNIAYRIPDPERIDDWIALAIKEENHHQGQIEVTFCNDSDLHAMNLEFLDHDTYTDILTFDYSADEALSGEIYISVDRVRENAKEFSVPFQEELNRVLIHGILHLCGYSDKQPADQDKMRSRENFWLERIK